MQIKKDFCIKKNNKKRKGNLVKLSPNYPLTITLTPRLFLILIFRSTFSLSKTHTKNTHNTYFYTNQKIHTHTHTSKIIHKSHRKIEEKDVDDVVEEQILTIKLIDEASSKKKEKGKKL